MSKKEKIEEGMAAGKIEEQKRTKGKPKQEKPLSQGEKTPPPDYSKYQLPPDHD